MLLSIIIPVYNVEKYIEKCLTSLVNQNLNVDDYEIIIINDETPDNSAKIAESFAEKYSCISVYHQKNTGVGVARNNGIKYAKGQYIYFIDPDDYLTTNALAKLLDYVIKYDPDILTFKTKTTTSYNELMPVEYSSKFEIDMRSGLSFIGDNGFKNEIWWYLIKRDFLQSTGTEFIKGRWMEDAIFTATLFIKAKKVCFVPIDTHRHVIVPNSAMTSKEPEHYKKVIYDNENAAIVYNNLLKDIDKSEYLEAYEVLKSRQASFVFFLIIRTIKSNLKFKELKDILSRMKQIGVYPFNHYFFKTYNNITYKILVKVFNNKTSLYLGFNTYRLFKKLRIAG